MRARGAVPAIRKGGEGGGRWKEGGEEGGMTPEVEGVCREKIYSY